MPTPSSASATGSRRSTGSGPKCISPMGPMVGRRPSLTFQVSNLKESMIAPAPAAPRKSARLCCSRSVVTSTATFPPSQIKEYQAHIQGSTHHVVQVRHASSDHDGHSVNGPTEGAFALPVITHTEIECGAGKAADRHGSLFHNLKPLHCPVPGNKFSCACPDPWLCIFSAAIRCPDILEHAYVAAAPIHLYCVFPAQQHVARQVLVIAPAFRDGVRKCR